MQVLHKTPFATALVPIMDADGTEARVAILKSTFLIGSNGQIRIADKQEPVYLVDTYLGEPGASSTILESDCAYFKPATDIAVVGSAHAPGGHCSRFQAELQVGCLRKRLAVFGERRWDSGFAGIEFSDPEPVNCVPLHWERAFGGRDNIANTWEQRNPIGTGFVEKNPRQILDGLPLPNFEDPANLINSWQDKPQPQGLGFVGRHWHPRRLRAGTYDAKWSEARMPMLPLDFDYRFFNGAPGDLIYPGFIEGGELVRAVNLSVAGYTEFTLPRQEVVFRGFVKRSSFEKEAVLDTVLFFFDECRMTLTYRLKYEVLINEPADLVRATVKGELWP